MNEIYPIEKNISISKKPANHYKQLTGQFNERLNINPDP